MKVRSQLDPPPPAVAVAYMWSGFFRAVGAEHTFQNEQLIFQWMDAGSTPAQTYVYESSDASDDEDVESMVGRRYVIP